jgi:hypothetical protein
MKIIASRHTIDKNNKISEITEERPYPSIFLNYKLNKLMEEQKMMGKN